MYQDLKKLNEEGVPEEFWKAFVTTICMTSMVADESFVYKLLKSEINLSDIFVPFVTDSDGVMLVKE